MLSKGTHCLDGPVQLCFAIYELEVLLRSGAFEISCSSLAHATDHWQSCRRVRRETSEDKRRDCQMYKDKTGGIFDETCCLEPYIVEVRPPLLAMHRNGKSEFALRDL